MSSGSRAYVSGHNTLSRRPLLGLTQSLRYTRSHLLRPPPSCPTRAESLYAAVGAILVLATVLHPSPFPLRPLRVPELRILPGSSLSALISMFSHLETFFNHCPGLPRQCFLLFATVRYILTRSRVRVIVRAYRSLPPCSLFLLSFSSPMLRLGFVFTGIMFSAHTLVIIALRRRWHRDRVSVHVYKLYYLHCESD